MKQASSYRSNCRVERKPVYTHFDVCAVSKWLEMRTRLRAGLWGVTIRILLLFVRYLRFEISRTFGIVRASPAALRILPGADS